MIVSVKESSRAHDHYVPRGGSSKFCFGVTRSMFQIPNRFQINISDFPYPISDPALKRLLLFK